MTYYFLRPPALPQIAYVGYVFLVLSAIWVLRGVYHSALILAGIALLLLMMRSWLRLDFQNKTITRFFSIIPYKTIKIRTMEKVIFSRKFVIRTYNSRASTSSFRLHEYEISLHADGEDHILQTGLDSELLLTKAGKIATVAGVPLDNRTT